MHLEIQSSTVRLHSSTDFSADISAVRVLNHTTPLQSRYSGDPVIHRLALRENHHNQKILLQVEGNVPQYDLSCRRWCILYNLPHNHHEEAPAHTDYCKRCYVPTIERS